MFETLDTVRQQEETAAWHREQKHGKIQFLLRTTLTIGAILTSFPYSMLRLHIAPGALHKAPVIALSYTPAFTSPTWKRCSRGAEARD
jgi:hypothetical protein